MSGGIDFLEEIAKFRAARRLWARIMKDKFGATNPRSCQRDDPGTGGGPGRGAGPWDSMLR
ncbi:MAG: hypothetical protein JRJ83_18100 [Deltaproteobacteria bacterium]|nr:hypothetical protein [Deltaproteobacteria bacterium]